MSKKTKKKVTRKTKTIELIKRYDLISELVFILRTKIDLISDDIIEIYFKNVTINLNFANSTIWILETKNEYIKHSFNWDKFNLSINGLAKIYKLNLIYGYKE